MLVLTISKSTAFLWVLLLPLYALSQKAVPYPATPLETNPAPKINVGANRTALYLPLLQGKTIGVVANATSVIAHEKGYTPLVDSLLLLGVVVQKVFAPEHGFRGTADAGEGVADGRDAATGLPIVSLYGNHRKPTAAQLEGLDVVVFDIQDVGVRFYTYIATLQRVMEACAAHNIPLVVLDRPNPNGHYVDGPTLHMKYASFLGLTPIPLVYGMTIGEYARMLNGEGWLQGGVQATLTVIPLEHYTHQSEYHLPIRPSPNLPNATAISLYPSLGLFEGTHVNAGRGTAFPFQCYGASFLDSTRYAFRYVPQPTFGAKHPKEAGKMCYGENLSQLKQRHGVCLQWLIGAYQSAPDKSRFFNTESFTRHAGTERLQQQIVAGCTEAEIKTSWQADLAAFKALREKYLLYDGGVRSGKALP